MRAHDALEYLKWIMNLSIVAPTAPAPQTIARVETGAFPGMTCGFMDLQVPLAGQAEPLCRPVRLPLGATPSLLAIGINATTDATQ
jgi:hypothetical protein